MVTDSAGSGKLTRSIVLKIFLSPSTTQHTHLRSISIKWNFSSKTVRLQFFSSN